MKKVLLLLCLVALTARAEPPVISFATDGVNGSETLLLCGDGFDKPGLEVQRWLPPQPKREDWPNEDIQRAALERTLKGEATPPAKPEGKPAKLTVSDITQHTCAAWLPLGGYTQVQALYLRTVEGAAVPWTINRPKLWWASPEFPAPGTRVRFFGRNLYAQYSGGQAAWLRDAGGKLQRLDYGFGFQFPVYDNRLTPPYEIGVELPPSLAPGDYDLFVHNGSGGDFGWSEPFKFTVKTPPPAPTFIVKASEHGAISDDDAGDSAALEKALAVAAARPDGGIVQLAAGVYHLSRNLRLPPKTILRGAGKGATTIATLHDAPFAEPFAHENFPDQDAGYYKASTGVTPMVWLREQCALEQLTLRGAPETLDILIGTRNGAGADIALRDCNIINRDPVWYRNGQYRFSGNCVLIAGATDGLEIRGCFIEGCNPIAPMMQLLRRAVISGNTLTSFPPGRSDCSGFRKPMECIFEDNYFLNAKRGLVIQPQGMAVHNLVANNHVEHTERGNNAGEVELWEGGTVAVGGKVKAAGARSLTGSGVVWEFTDRKGAKRDMRAKVIGHVCLITKGRGLGQYRFIKKLDGDMLTLDRPWDVLPGPGAEFVVSTSSIENLILNNSDRDGDAGMQFWGGCIANVISGHISEDTEGIILEAADQRDKPGALADTQQCWFNDIRLCRFERGARLQIWPMRRPDAAFDDAGPQVFGNTVRECMWGDAPRLPHQNQWSAFWEQKHFHPDPATPLENHIAIRLAVKGGWVGDPDDAKWDTLTPAATANIIERNFVDAGWPVGIYETRSCRGNIITNNLLAAKQPLVRAAANKLEK
ncbi:MAG: glycosyl hydrolase family 28-related protein [Kiritimatiellaeota bacterium]|nr:glycosyl hydrolase family 28-related protein [Kiritimatiellota bacterium]